MDMDKLHRESQSPVWRWAKLFNSKFSVERFKSS